LDILFSVPIEPKGKPRATPVRMGKSGRVRMVKTKSTRDWANTVSLHAAMYLPAYLIDEPVRVDILAVHGRPAYMKKKDRKGEYRHPTGLTPCRKKPDIDNIVKHVYDALKRFWKDDCLVVDGRSAKVYSEIDGDARIVIRVRSVSTIEEDDWLKEMADA
jgi:Holliday junction resolvase RusA-like endonuclease